MIKDILQFYFTFKGRATRYEYNVYFILVATAGGIVASLLDWLFFGTTTIPVERDPLSGMGQLITSVPIFDNPAHPRAIHPLSGLWQLIIIIPFFALTTRRLHDLNISGRWQILLNVLIPIITILCGFMWFIGIVSQNAQGVTIGSIGMSVLGILLIVFSLALTMKRGTIGPNKFGEDPLEGNNNV